MPRRSAGSKAELMWSSASPVQLCEDRSSTNGGLHNLIEMILDENRPAGNPIKEIVAVERRGGVISQNIRLGGHCSCLLCVSLQQATTQRISNVNAVIANW